MATDGLRTATTVPDVALHDIMEDLAYLRADVENGTTTPHLHQVISEYIQADTAQNAFLSAIITPQQRMPFALRAPVDFALGQRRDAVRNDLIQKLRVFHQALGGTHTLAEKIESLRYAGSAELPQEAQQIVSGLQRNVIASAHLAFQQMQQQLKSGLWGSLKPKEERFAQFFGWAESDLSWALTQFDAGDTAAALQLYNDVMTAQRDAIAEFSWASSINFHLKFVTGIGTLFGAGVVAAYTGGLTLSTLTGSAAVTETTGIGAFTASLLVGGTTFTATDKFLNHLILNIPAFKSHDPLENALAFTGDSLKAAAMMGYLRGFGEVAAFPTYSGVAAPMVNLGGRVGTDFLGMTSFTTMADGPSQAFAPEGMAQTLATILGLRTGHGLIAMERQWVTTGDIHTPPNIEPVPQTPAINPPAPTIVVTAPHAVIELPDNIRLQQQSALHAERHSVTLQRKAAAELISDTLPDNARILILDLSGSAGIDLSTVPDVQLVRDLQSLQFGGKIATGGNMFRHIMGFKPDDERVTVWNLAQDPHRTAIPRPDFWLATGGPAMPSELDPGNETSNTIWLRRAVTVMQELQTMRTPGFAACLGHQLWSYSQGARVGKLQPQREYGTVTIQATDIGRQLGLFKDVWDVEGGLAISASHSESVLTPPRVDGMEIIAGNGYSSFQGAAYPLRPGQTIAEAEAEGNLVVTLQNHPEVLAHYLHAMRFARGEKMRAEGLSPETMVFQNTPEARNLWLNVITMVADLAGKRAHHLSATSFFFDVEPKEPQLARKLLQPNAQLTVDDFDAKLEHLHPWAMDQLSKLGALQEKPDAVAFETLSLLARQQVLTGSEVQHVAETMRDLVLNGTALVRHLAMNTYVEMVDGGYMTAEQACAGVMEMVAQLPQLCEHDQITLLLGISRIIPWLDPIHATLEHDLAPLAQQITIEGNSTRQPNIIAMQILDELRERQDTQLRVHVPLRSTPYTSDLRHLTHLEKIICITDREIQIGESEAVIATSAAAAYRKITQFAQERAQILGYGDDTVRAEIDGLYLRRVSSLSGLRPYNLRGTARNFFDLADRDFLQVEFMANVAYWHREVLHPQSFTINLPMPARQAVMMRELHHIAEDFAKMKELIPTIRPQMLEIIAELQRWANGPAGFTRIMARETLPELQRVFGP